jgi:hypothetical protein
VVPPLVPPDVPPFVVPPLVPPVVPPEVPPLLDPPLMDPPLVEPPEVPPPIVPPLELPPEVPPLPEGFTSSLFKDSKLFGAQPCMLRASPPAAMIQASFIVIVLKTVITHSLLLFFLSVERFGRSEMSPHKNSLLLPSSDATAVPEPKTMNFPGKIPK